MDNELRQHTTPLDRLTSKWLVKTDTTDGQTVTPTQIAAKVTNTLGSQTVTPIDIDRLEGS